MLLNELVHPLRGLRRLGLWQEVLATRLGFTYGEGLHLMTSEELCEFARQLGCEPQPTMLSKLWYNHCAVLASKAR